MKSIIKYRYRVEGGVYGIPQIIPFEDFETEWSFRDALIKAEKALEDGYNDVRIVQEILTLEIVACKENYYNKSGSSLKGGEDVK